MLTYSKMINLNCIYNSYEWLIKILGHQTKPKSNSRFPKIASFIWFFMIHSFLINLICVSSVAMSHSVPLYLDIFVACSCSIMIWYFCKCKIRNLRKIIFKIRSTELRYNFKPYLFRLLNFFLVSIFCFTVCFISLCVYFIEFAPEYQQRVFTFNTVLHSNLTKISARIFSITTYFLTLYTFPLVSSLLCCLIYYHFSKVLLQCRQRLQREFWEQKITVNAQYILQLFNQLSDLIKLSNKIKEELSPIVFLHISLQIVLLFGNTVSIVTVPISEMDFQYRVEVFLGPILSLSGITSIIISASLIEKRWLDIQNQILIVHDVYIHYQKKDTFTLELIRYILSIKFPVMTILSEIKLQPSLVLSSIGISLSFGLLSKQILDQG